ncbi:MAG: TraB/GumN family protein [Bacilli bacterium]|nr:TraB/GumN family protein [Bacilli bacterium]
MNKILKNLFLIVIALTLFLAGCQKKEVVKDDKTNVENTTPLFYRISKEDSDINIYLLGSIHAADKGIYPLNDTIMSSYNKSDYLAVEVDTVALTSDFDLQVSLAQKMLYTDGTTIKDHIGEELYTKMVAKLKEKGSYNSMYDNYKPAFFESLFENAIIVDADMDANAGIDMHFLKLAKKENKNILEIETAASQYDLLLNNPIELDKMMLEGYVESYDESISEMKDLYNAWKKGDANELEQKLMSTSSEGLSQTEIEMIENYNNTLINKRNYIMTDALEKYYAEEKNVFCVVGVGHVVGDQGIISLMEQRGYNVEKLN